MTDAQSSTPPPPPFDDPSCTNPLNCPPLRWGLIGCGRVSHDFTQALKHVPTAKVVACAARDVKRAQDFANKHKVDKAYGSYDELVNDENVDIVYVGNVHSFRRVDVEKALMADKHVLAEKPFACTYEDAEYFIKLAKERNLFIMEGMWTRFFPAVEQARRLVNGVVDTSGNIIEKGILGEVVNVSSDFNFNASDNDEYPASFLYQRKLGGGATLLTAPYPIAATTLFFGGAMPDSIKVTGQVDNSTEVDLQAAIALSFPPTGSVAPVNDDSKANEMTPKLPGCGIACLSYGMLCESEEITTVVGTKGRLTIETPCHCPTGLTVRLKATGRSVVGEELIYNFPLPEDSEEIKSSGGYFYPNSAGFCYEAAAVARCIAAGKKECPQYTLTETLVEMKILEEARKQLGVKTVYEN